MNSTDRPGGSPKRRTTDAAEYLGMGKSTLEKLRLTGDGPRYSKIGRRIVIYDEVDLDAWVAARQRRSTSDPGQAA
ncbi:MAG: helix-turn-helix domain-containing protein [Stellaceae bacterium]